MKEQVRAGKLSLVAATTMFSGILLAGFSSVALSDPGCQFGADCNISNPWIPLNIEGNCGIAYWISEACVCGAGSSPEDFVFQWQGGPPCWID